MNDRETKIKAAAYEMGFQYIGFAKAEFLDDEAPRLEAWLNKGYQGNMAYMNNYFDQRLDPSRLVDGAKSVISLLYNYYNPQTNTDPDAPKISRYAYGKDYHFVVKDKLRQLVQWIRTEIGDINARVFVDSAPVLERAWAARSGLGWIGKNSMLINRSAGSFFFLAEIISDLDLAPDPPVVKDYCGTCRRCIDACPTQAIVDNKTIDASRCISYFTIELRDALLPQAMAGQFDNWMFGCDICQDVCPWNRFAAPHREPAFAPHPDLLQMTRREWTELTEEIFSQIFKQSAVKRTKFAGLKRNIAFLTNHTY
jgi:epoxyqueuosine reductase